MVSRDSGFGARGSGRTATGWGKAAGFWIQGTGGWALVLLISILAQGEAGLVGPIPAEDLTINLRVHDYARIERRLLIRTQGEVTRLFQEMGIRIHWIECPLVASELDRYPACQEPLGLTGLDVNILPRSMAERLPHSPTALGLTPMTQEGERASLATVFSDRVREEADPGAVRFAPILGHAMAHEIGHMLLRTSDHAPSGLMGERWSLEDLRLASQGQLCFNSEQAAVIRAEVRQRLQSPRQTASRK